LTRTADVGSSYRDNLAALRSAQKPSRGTPAYSRYVNRPLGRRVAALAHRYALTPNQATAVSALLSSAGIAVVAAARPTWWSGLAAAVLLAAGYVLDSVDGQLARLRGGGSVAGEWLDHTVDCFKTSAVHLAVLVSWYRHPPVEDTWALLVPIVFEVVATATYFGLIVVPYLRRARGTASQPAKPTRGEHPLRTWAILPTDYGLFCWVFVLLGAPRLFFAAYTALALIAAAALVLALRKWWGELTALDAPPPGDGD
jgi:hypothetical protein